VTDSNKHQHHCYTAASCSPCTLPLLQDLYRMRDSCLARVSDDFYPRLPASHTTHVAVCAFNSLFFGPLVQPDWDMFHSMHPR
jgi:raffinose synthase